MSLFRRILRPCRAAEQTGSVLRTGARFFRSGLAFAMVWTSTARLDAQPRETGQPQLFAIEHVNLIPMTVGSGVLRDATLIIDGGKIVALNAAVPARATRIDGRGKWMIPGLVDMHVHIPVDGHFNTAFPTRAAAIFTRTQDLMTPFVANGVTTVLELNAKAGHFGQRNEISRGDVIGPRMALAALINGGTGSGRIAHTPADGRQSVRMAKAEGYEFIKVYSQLDTGTFIAIVDEARVQGMKVVGHIPNAFQGSLPAAFVPNFGMVAHAEELAKHARSFDDREAEAFARLIRRSGSWLSPTLTIIGRALEQARSLDSLNRLVGFSYVHPLLQSKWLTANAYHTGADAARIARFEHIIAFSRKLVAACGRLGVPIVAGTDAGSSGLVWGFALHDELVLLRDAGLSNEEALAAATRLAATWLGIDRNIGTIEPGKLADLVLLDANPLHDIRNTRRIAGVFVAGRWLDKPRIDSMLSDLAARNTASRERYDWARRSEY